AIRYSVTPRNQSAEVIFKPYLNSDVHNQDANWEETFWEALDSGIEDDFAFVQAKTLKTEFNVVTYMKNSVLLDGKPQDFSPSVESYTSSRVQFDYPITVEKGKTVSLIKYAGYTVSTNHPEGKLKAAAQEITRKAESRGFDKLLQQQKEAWADIWKMADITIQGDIKAQQGIRFNIFQLNQTYSGKDARLNIGPK